MDVALAIAVPMALLWGASLVRRDASLVDRWWGAAFVVVTAVVWASGPRDLRATVVLALVAIWGLRLSAYLTWRNWGHGEDRRYQTFRRTWPAFWLTSAVGVFGLQGLLVWVVSWPVRHAVAVAVPWSGVDALAVALWLVGFAFESGGDAQLAAFKARDDTDGAVLDTGFWRVTRHPNYFGDACQWWAFGLFGVTTPGGLPTVVGPAVMTFLLLRVSGVALLERDIEARRPAYADYVRRTNAFFPWFPRPPSNRDPRDTDTRSST